jgi:hypothetical protein
MSERAPRASCVRCNALLGPGEFEADWRFARCAKCGARSPVPETVRAGRPETFAGGVARALDDVLATRPERVRVQRATRGDEVVLEVHARAPGIGEVVRVWLQRAVAPAATDPSSWIPSQSMLLDWKLTIRMRPEGQRWRLRSSVAGEVVLDAPLRVLARDTGPAGAELLVRGGHPVHEEWIAATLERREHARWIAEWLHAALAAHVEESQADVPVRGPTAYRR